MSRTTADAVRAELDVSESDYPSEEDSGVTQTQLLDRWITRAHLVVNKRLPGEDNTELLTELETLVAAHFGHPEITGGATSERVSSISQGSRSINFEMDDVPGDDGQTPYWHMAVTLDGRIATSPGAKWSISNT